MKIYKISILFLLVANGVFAQVDQDGPYLKLFGNQVVSKAVLNNIVKVDTLNQNQTIKVEFLNQKDWDFNFTLQQTVETPPSTYDAPKKLLILSDIEGEFSAFRSLMIGNKVIDKNYNWIFGKGHLVICGDLFDRGKDVMPYLWLLYKLEQSALKKGGFVHVILGNHDIMNMAGDFRYQVSKYPAAAKLFGVDYQELIAENTEIGKWLRSKNMMEKIGEGLFMHGGISEKINTLNLTLNELNQEARLCYGLKGNNLSKVGKLLMGNEGPFWYRGYFGKNNIQQTVDNTLSKFDVKQIVVGHTITTDNIASYYNGKVIGVDVDEHHGNHKALLINGKKYFVVNENGEKSALKSVSN